MSLGGYVGRLAPSPTGLLHLGHVRTFGVAHARARSFDLGSLLLRVDDLDPQRSRDAFVAAALEDLRWLGLGWDGEPWFQSGRGAAYRLAWERLVERGWVYPCCCSRGELARIAGAPHEGAVGGSGAAMAEPAEVVYPGTCRPLWPPEAAAGVAEREAWLAAGPEGRNWRFRVPDGKRVAFVDGGCGPQRFVAGRDFGDFAVWRRDGIPAYQLATVVDDAAMGVTEVVRGADLLLSTARQMLLLRALGLENPAWWHCPLVVDARGERLAKRTDALSVRALREQGVSAAEVVKMTRAARVELQGPATVAYVQGFENMEKIPVVKHHEYMVEVEWTGNLGEGTASYGGYAREHTLRAAGKAGIAGSSDAAFRGDRTRWNPEELLVGSLAACHQLWYLHLCAVSGVVVETYVDRAVGHMVEDAGGSGLFASVTLRPHARLAPGSDEAQARRLHAEAAKLCFIARSVSFPVHHEPSFEIAGMKEDSTCPVGV